MAGSQIALYPLDLRDCRPDVLDRIHRSIRMGTRIGLSLAAIVLAGSLTSCVAQQIPYPDYAVTRLEGVTIPGLPAVTGRIAVYQFGYLPDSDKVAVITNPIR